MFLLTLFCSVTTPVHFCPFGLASTNGRSQPAFWHFSLRTDTGVLYPAGKSGGGRGGPSVGAAAAAAAASAGFGFDEFPAFPDRTTFCGRLFGAIPTYMSCSMLCIDEL